MIFLLQVFLSVIILLLFIIDDNAEGHKLIDTSENDNNNNFENALEIPNHTISWAIYQELIRGEIDAKFYKFQNEQINSSLYVQLTIPEIEKYKAFTPSLAILEPQFNSNNVSINMRNDNYTAYQNNNDILPFEIPQNYRILLKTDYQGPIPSPIFYEPFTQTSYWERQEIRTEIQNLGTYYIVVFNNNNTSIEEGKFALAVGEVEDFSALDFFILIPYSWIQLKIFYNDYFSFVIAIIIVISFILIILLLIKKRRHRK
ncbi:MAG: hypothetical protein ACPKPY_05620 [Nitrososphaeraceae archaeon]